MQCMSLRKKIREKKQKQVSSIYLSLTKHSQSDSQTE